MRRFLLIFSLCILTGCNKSDSGHSYFDGVYYHDLPTSGWGEEVLSRANLISGISWTPSANVPKAGKAGGYFSPGAGVSGIPYSAVSAEEGSVGIQTSFYTFMSSVNNPHSTLYTVDYRSGGDNLKAARYGCVCSSAVMYAWGCAFGYYTEQIYDEEVPFIIKKADQTLEGLNLFDAICYYSEEQAGGHIMMAYDIARNAAGEIKKVSIFESSAPTAHITAYTLEALKKRISGFSAPIKIFCADNESLSEMEPLPQYVEQGGTITGPFPPEICLNDGDKRTFAKGQDVRIDILSDGFDFIQLFKDDALYRTDVAGDTIRYENLPVGLYSAKLADSNGKTSESTYFEVGETDYDLEYDGQNINITCPDNSSRPVYVTMNGGDKQLLKRSDTGSWTLTPKSGSTYCRVHFAGKYSGYSGLSKQFK